MRTLTVLAGFALALTLPLSGCDSTGLDTGTCYGCTGGGDDGAGGSHDGGTAGGSDDGGSTDGGTAGGSDTGGGSTGTDGGSTTGFIQIDPRQTYLRTNGDKAVDAPALRLADEGLMAGDVVCATAVGDYDIGGGVSARSRNAPLVTAIFSADDVLLADDQRVRVQKAVEAGDNVTTLNTESEGFATDVTQDFDATSVCVTIPEGANFVFLSAYDTFFGDNADVNAGGQPFGLSLKF